MAYSPTGALLVSGGLSEKVRVWSCVEHRLLQELADSTRLLHFRAAGRSLLSLDANGNAVWWDTVTWKPMRKFTVSTGDEWRQTVSPDQRLLAVNRPEPGVRWLDVATGKHLPATGADQPRSFVTAMAFSPDGQWLETQTKALGCPALHGKPCNELALRIGTLLVSGSATALGWTRRALGQA